MAVILRELVKNYKLLIYEYGDKRTVDWPFQSSPWQTLGILAAYVWFVKVGGPAFMKNRKPYNIDRIIQIYNLVQVVACTCVAVEAFRHTYSPWGKYNWGCQPVDFTDDEFNRYILKFSYSYFLLKKLDLLDTIFFVLRKKYSQVTFLHLYHHVLMVVVIWVGMRIAPNGHGAFVAVINSFVHSVMYSYYFITNWNPEYKKKIWWKKYITQLQMVQFLAIFIHFLRLIVFHPDCNYPLFVVAVNLPQNLFIFILFADFYRKAYLRKPKAEENLEKIK